MILSKKIIDICNLGLSNEKTIKLVEQAIAEVQPYDHFNNDVNKACGISDKNLHIILPGGTQSEIVEQIENQFNKRELAYLVHHVTQKVSIVTNNRLFGWLFRILFKT